MNIDMQTLLAVYDERLIELSKENIYLKSLVRQNELNKEPQLEEEKTKAV